MRNPKQRPELEKGPFFVHQVSEGSRYEMDRGRPIYCAPTGADGSRSVGVGFEVLDTDPAVESAGVDTGYALDDKTLWAPDIAVGNVPQAPGWVRGSVPPLAVEYAGPAQDEAALQTKIADLLAAGTRWVWVVRLVGPHRVEVYELERPVRTLSHGEHLHAPGVLRNPVLVDALFDREASHEATLRNLLQRRGYQGLDDVRAEGREAGREEGREAGERRGLEEAVAALCDVLEIPLTDERRATVSSSGLADLRALVDRLRHQRRWD